MDSVALILLGALAGAVATNGGKEILAYFERKRQRRVAARLLYGDIVYAGRAFQLSMKKGAWSERLDFTSALETWREARTDFAAVASALEWVNVSAFYANLERSARSIRPGEKLSENDRVVCASQTRYANEASPAVVAYIAKNPKEQKELVTAITAEAVRHASEADDHSPRSEHP